MKVTLEHLLELVAKAKPDWSIQRLPRTDGTDAVVGQIDHGCIDVWRFGEDDHARKRRDVTALMSYICTACVMLPRIEAALSNLRDRGLIRDTDGDHMTEINELLAELNSIELQSDSDSTHQPSTH